MISAFALLIEGKARTGQQQPCEILACACAGAFEGTFDLPAALLDRRTCLCVQAGAMAAGVEEQKWVAQMLQQGLLDGQFEQLLQLQADDG